MLISEAYAQSAGASAQGQLVQFLPIILMFVVLYFLMIRPQMKRAKETRAMIEALKKGDEVVTSGGIIGKITKVTDGYITLEVARQGGDAVEMTFQRAAVQTLLPNGTIKSI
ncbi:MAG: preprotein translocase subunit YajC [Burkholderiaceae bacterium]